MLRAAKVDGTVIARLEIDRRGAVSNITFDSTGHAHDLFRWSARKALVSIQFVPAMRFGLAHSGTFTYWVQYVLGGIDPGSQGPQSLTGADSVRGCPVARDETHLVVCGLPEFRRATIN